MLFHWVNIFDDFVNSQQQSRYNLYGWLKQNCQIKTNLLFVTSRVKESNNMLTIRKNFVSGISPVELSKTNSQTNPVYHDESKSPKQKIHLQIAKKKNINLVVVCFDYQCGISLRVPLGVESPHIKLVFDVKMRLRQFNVYVIWNFQIYSKF